MSIVLDRRQFTKTLNLNTPKCVLRQIAQTLGFDINMNNDNDEYNENIYKKLNNYKSNNIVLYPSSLTKDGALIARFVNPNCIWDKENLRLAYNHLVSFYDKIEIPNSGFNYGNKTPNNVLSYDCCMLYAICNELKILTNRNTTIEKMKLSIELSFQSEEKILKQAIQMVKNMRKSARINLLLSNDLSINNGNNNGNNNDDIERNSCKDLKSIYDNVTDITKLMYRTNPTSHSEAIILSAMIYGIDLTQSINPLIQFKEIKFRKVFKRVQVE